MGGRGGGSEQGRRGTVYTLVRAVYTGIHSGPYIIMGARLFGTWGFEIFHKLSHLRLDKVPESPRESPR